MDNFIETIAGNNGFSDNHGNILISNGDQGMLSCSDGQSHLMTLQDQAVDILNGFYHLVQDDLGYDTQRINLGDLSSPLQVICDDLDSSPQR